MSKIAIRFGHQTTGADGGAVGYVKETDVNRRYGALIVSKLKTLGHEVLDVTPPESNRSLADSLNYGIIKANEWKADLFVSCHVNAFSLVDNAMGCEVVVGSQKGFDLGTRIVNELANIGFKSRGAKYDTRGLAEIRQTNMVALICEPFFLDSKADIDVYNKVGDEGIATAIVKGITGQVVYQPIPQPQQSKINYDTLVMQKNLNRLGFVGADGDRLFLDGIMGNNTTYAIKEFQKVCGLTIDGVFGTASSNAMDYILSKPTCGLAYKTPIATRYIQWRLHISIDGVFGQGTANAVIRWQTSNGLVKDGIFGLNSWRVMIS